MGSVVPLRLSHVGGAQRGPNQLQVAQAGHVASALVILDEDDERGDVLKLDEVQRYGLRGAVEDQGLGGRQVLDVVKRQVVFVEEELDRLWGCGLIRG